MFQRGVGPPRWQWSLQLLADMAQSCEGGGMDAFCVNAAMGACGRGEMWEAALSLFQQLGESLAHPVPQEPEFWDLFIAGIFEMTLDFEVRQKMLQESSMLFLVEAGRIPPPCPTSGTLVPQQAQQGPRLIYSGRSGGE